MTSKDNNLRVPKLHADGSNWVTYRDWLHWALNARGILFHIEFNIPKPLIKTAEEISAGSLPPKTPARPPKKGADDPQASEDPDEPTPLAKMFSNATGLTYAQ